MAKYVPKLYHFEFDHMELGTILAALDNNMNVGRVQKKKTITQKGQTKIKIKNHYRIAYRKPSKKFVARKVYNKKSYQYLREMFSEFRRNALVGFRSSTPSKKKRMAPAVRNRSRDEIIEDSLKYKRFKY